MIDWTVLVYVFSVAAVVAAWVRCCNSPTQGWRTTEVALSALAILHIIMSQVQLRHDVAGGAVDANAAAVVIHGNWVMGLVVITWVAVRQIEKIFGSKS